MKAVFDTKPTSVYDDELSEHYQIPPRYLSVVRQCIGDWVILRRPRADGGSLAYFATARVQSIEPDQSNPRMSYARLSEYLSFDQPVPWTTGGRYAEAGLRNIPRPQVGRYLRGKSVRPLSDADFAEIVRRGLQKTLDPANAVQLDLDPDELDEETQQFLHAPIPEQERRIEQILMNRKIRDANFRQQVCEAYGNCCAVTGLKIINGGGRAEVQAAHIWSVAAGGPDVVQNGVALCGTAHWLFDRNLISITDDYRLLISHNKVPNELRPLFAKQLKRIRLPGDQKLWPHPAYIAKRRSLFD